MTGMTHIVRLGLNSMVEFLRMDNFSFGTVSNSLMPYSSETALDISYRLVVPMLATVVSDLYSGS